MLLSELMANITIKADYTGILTNDDNILAVNISGEASANVDTYAVVQGAIVGVDSQLNPVTQSKQYLRAGLSTTKTGTQRTFSATGDRYIGDEFQDWAFAHGKMYGTGEAVVTDYVWFNLYNGKGEKGRVSIIVNSDGSGNAGETAGIDVQLQKSGALPEEFIYSPATPPSGD